MKQTVGENAVFLELSGFLLYSYWDSSCTSPKIRIRFLNAKCVYQMCVWMEGAETGPNGGCFTFKFSCFPKSASAIVIIFKSCNWNFFFIYFFLSLFFWWKTMTPPFYQLWPKGLRLLNRMEVIFKQKWLKVWSLELGFVLFAWFFFFNLWF